MKKPIIYDNKPKATDIEAGKDYYFCTCGKSSNQPFCDGSHKGSEFTPKKFTAEKSEKAYLCNCKHSGNLPYCDGTHKKFEDEMIGKEGPGISNQNDSPVAEPTKDEPTVDFIHELAREGLSNMGHHGPMAAMGVPRHTLPSWDDIQILVAQLDKKPLIESTKVKTSLVIGPKAKKPLILETPLFVSDMSFGALSAEAKIALAKGAELAGTGICSGEGGMLPEEQQANSRYFYELATAKFGYNEEQLKNVQAFHFKAGQGAKTGTGGHLPGEKNTEEISKVRGIEAGTDAISPPTFTDLTSPKDFKKFADRVREVSGGIPIGFKMSANHIEKDIDFALEATADYIILDGRGGGTGAAPLLFRDNISIPTIPGLARARYHLDNHTKGKDITLIITGGLRTHNDFIKALALGADGIAIANSALQSIGCVAARICNTNNCPAGIATQKQDLRQRLNIEKSANQLANFLNASTELMKVMARACGHDDLQNFNRQDLTTWDKEMSELSGVQFGGVIS
jgi:glutamate synthase domain-containing protein 2/CDGSH-type Zn-finger protein